MRRCVGLYLFLLPFQIVEEFGWYTIPAVTIAAFFFLGFLAAAEELEQPFGYDEASEGTQHFELTAEWGLSPCRIQNDLDLDLFCREIIHADIEGLRRTPSPNVLPSKSSLGGETCAGGSLAHSAAERAKHAPLR